MMRHKLKTACEKPIAKDKCRHYWVLENPNGPVSKGVCKLCGAERKFNNRFLDLWWEDNTSFLPKLSSGQDTESDEESDDF